MSDRSLPQSLAAQLGAAIRARRAIANRPQSDLARSLGVRRQTIADLESGRNVGLHVALGALAELNLHAVIAALAAAEAPPVEKDSAPPQWPDNWSVVDNWDRFDAVSRDRLEAQMRGASSAAVNRDEAFVFAPLDVRAARVVRSPEFEAMNEF